MKHISRLLMIGCYAASLQAGTLLSIQPGAVPAGTPSTGNVFDVLLTNTGPSSITVGGFAFGVSVTNPDITLTGADFATLIDPYLFVGQSLDVDLSTSLNSSSGATLDGGDASDGTGATLAAGQTLALGEVFFSIAANAIPGLNTVSFTGGTSGNNLSNVAGGPITIDNLTNGSVNITVPEPPSLLLGLIALSGIAILRFRRQERVLQSK
jgi:hypothetical protein